MGSCHTNPLLPPSWRCSISTWDDRPSHPFQYPRLSPSMVRVNQMVEPGPGGASGVGLSVGRGRCVRCVACVGCAVGASWDRWAGQWRGVAESADPFAVHAQFGADVAGDAADDPVHQFVQLELGELARVEPAGRDRRVRRGRVPLRRGALTRRVRGRVAGRRRALGLRRTVGRRVGRSLLRRRGQQVVQGRGHGGRRVRGEGTGGGAAPEEALDGGRGGGVGVRRRCRGCADGVRRAGR